jgi:hypothetical protein
MPCLTFAHYLLDLFRLRHLWLNDSGRLALLSFIEQQVLRRYLHQIVGRSMPIGLGVFKDRTFAPI